MNARAARGAEKTQQKTADGAVSTRKPRIMPTWAIVTISVIFGLFFAYFVWNAIDFLITQATGTLSLNGYGWFVLLFAVVFPLIAFGIAFAIGLATGVVGIQPRAPERSRRGRGVLARRAGLQRDQRRLDARLSTRVTRSSGPLAGR